MKRKIKIDFYKGLDTDMLKVVFFLLSDFCDEYADKVERARDDRRLVNLVLKERGE